MTPTLSTVGDTTTSTTILASNGARLGAIIQNTSTAILYLRLDGGTATATTGHSIQLAAITSYTLPTITTNGATLCYRGTITGVWATDAGGSANVTEWA